MENREIQYLDPKYAKKKAQQEKELAKFYGGKKRSAEEIQKFLATMTDPKKFPVKKWEDMMLRVYAMVKDLNSK